MATLRKWLIFLNYVSFAVIWHYLNLYFIVEKPENEYDVLERLSYIDAKWREIGLRLRVSSNDLDSLDQDRVSNEIRLAKVIRRWIEMDGQATPVNWKTIIKVVNDLDRRLAINTYYYLKDKQNAAGKLIRWFLHLIMLSS